MGMIGVDVGGTFTDAVFYDDSGRLRWSKAPTLPASPAEGVLTAIELAGADLAAIDRFVHGVTIGTNAILERKGAEVRMLTTRGFGDTLEIARTNRTTLYDIKTLKPPALVPRQRVIELDERMRADGSVLKALDRTQLEAAVAALAAEDPAALAVCLLHSYANGDHEAEAAALLRERLPGAFVCSSSEVLPEMREYERFSTAVLNAYIGPITAAYLGALARMLRGGGYANTVYIMISSGGIITAERAARFPVQTVLSGPAGGVAAASHLGEALGLGNLITCDMGGTSTDVCLIHDLSAPVTSDQYIDSYPIRCPQIEINTVGAGGGSIAWIDTGTILKVGPQSAGADPGPAAYGRGGTEPTVTDANLVLGRLSPDTRLAGSVALHPERAEQAVDRIAGTIAGLDRQAAADGIVQIAVARMVSALKEISIVRGYDPRDFVLVAYGGAGPMHAALIAEELEIDQVLVPPNPGNFSAFGALISDIRHDHVRTHLAEVQDLDPGSLERSFRDMEERATEEMAAEGIARERIATARACGMRYVGQSWDLPVPLAGPLEDLRRLESLFHEVHERRFGYRTEDRAEVVSLRVSAIGRVDKPRLPEADPEGSLEAARTESRPVYLAGARHDTPVYRRDRLPRGARLAGPGIVEEMGAVTVIPPGWSAEVGRFGELHMKRSAP